MQFKRAFNRHSHVEGCGGERRRNSDDQTRRQAHTQITGFLNPAAVDVNAGSDSGHGNDNVDVGEKSRRHRRP